MSSILQKQFSLKQKQILPRGLVLNTESADEPMVDKEKQCPICLLEITSSDVHALPCAHRFHLSCVMTWLKVSSHSVLFYGKIHD